MRIALASLAAAMLSVSTAFADECPADQRGASAPAPMAAPQGLTEQTLVAFDLSENYGIAGRLLRLRRITVAPGGAIPWHEHRERPGVVTILSGEMMEYRSTCRTPIVHRAGDSVAENGPFFHQWRNDGNASAVILTADLPPAPETR
jgi:quercetin dioxygenase-like cupin family protein